MDARLHHAFLDRKVEQRGIELYEGVFHRAISAVAVGASSAAQRARGRGAGIKVVVAPLTGTRRIFYLNVEAMECVLVVPGLVDRPVAGSRIDLHHEHALIWPCSGLPEALVSLRRNINVGEHWIGDRTSGIVH